MASWMWKQGLTKSDVYPQLLHSCPRSPNMTVRSRKQHWTKLYTWNPTELRAPQSQSTAGKSDVGSLGTTLLFRVGLVLNCSTSLAFCGPSPQGSMSPPCWQLYPYLQNHPQEVCCMLWADLSASRNPAWSPLAIMNCPIVHVVQVIREEKNQWETL